eukprot:1612851-Prymnesium_polylepis.1
MCFWDVGHANAAARPVLLLLVIWQVGGTPILIWHAPRHLAGGRHRAVVEAAAARVGSFFTARDALGVERLEAGCAAGPSSVPTHATGRAPI